MPPMTRKSIFLQPTDENELIDIVNSLNASSACGPHSIPTNLLRLGSHLLAAPISLIINQSFTQGIFPDVLKIAKVVPIYKSGDAKYCSNYRPISLLSNLSKVLEKAMHSRVSAYLEKFKLIYDLQFGFRKHNSSSHALINFVNTVSDVLDRGDLHVVCF